MFCNQKYSNKEPKHEKNSSATCKFKWDRQCLAQTEVEKQAVT